MADERSGKEETVFRIDTWLLETSRQSEALDEYTRSIIRAMSIEEWVQTSSREIRKCDQMLSREDTDSRDGSEVSKSAAKKE